jgi:hypothetical protein
MHLKLLNASASYPQRSGSRLRQFRRSMKINNICMDFLPSAYILLR